MDGPRAFPMAFCFPRVRDTECLTDFPITRPVYDICRLGTGAYFGEMVYSVATEGEMGAFQSAQSGVLNDAFDPSVCDEDYAALANKCGFGDAFDWTPLREGDVPTEAFIPVLHGQSWPEFVNSPEDDEDASYRKCKKRMQEIELWYVHGCYTEADCHRINVSTFCLPSSTSGAIMFLQESEFEPCAYTKGGNYSSGSGDVILVPRACLRK